MKKQSKGRKVSTWTRKDAASWYVYICQSIAGVQRLCVEACTRVLGGSIAESIEIINEIDEISTPSNGNGVKFFIICLSSHYESYLTLRENYYIPIVTPLWIFRSVLQNNQVLLPTEKFSACPTKVFSSIVLYCVQVEADPRKVIASLMNNGGGQLVSNQTTAATHVLCLRSNGPDFKQALEWQSQTKRLLDEVVSKIGEVRDECEQYIKSEKTGSLPEIVIQYLMGQCGLLSPQIVSYDWVQECVRSGRRVPEGKFSFPDKPPQVPEEEMTLQDLIETCQKQHIYPSTAVDELWKDTSLVSSDALAGNIFLLARHIPPHFRQRMTQALEAFGANVLQVTKGDTMIQIPKATFVVCGYQSGNEYTTALKLNKPVVSMQWVAACISAKAIVSNASSPKTSPIRQALYSPALSHGVIPGMEGCVVTLSGFSGRSNPSRDDIQALVRLTGACYLSVLSRSHTTHLLCLEASGEKHKRAIAWGMTNVVKYEWLVQCARRWSKLPESEYSWLKPTKVPAISKPVDPSIQVVDTASKFAPKFQLADALHALDEKENTPLKNPSKPVEKISNNPSPEKPAAAVTTPVQLRKAIETNSIDEIKPKKSTEIKKTTKKRKEPEKTEIDESKATTTTKKPNRKKEEVKSTRVFLLSGSHEEMAINESIVMALGGIVSPSKRQFDPNCTHIICKDLKRTEKVIAGIASGKWILTPSYLTKSLEHGEYLEEEPFEWGQSKILKGIVCDERIYLPVIQYWRHEIAAGHPGPFSGQKFGIYGETTPPNDMCQRIIKASGGIFINSSREYDKNTILLIGENIKKNKIKKWQNNNIICIQPGYLIDYITKDQNKKIDFKFYMIHST